jgi:alkylation response protein AidB-like acyl-CoA dehydrogenase
MKMRETLDPQAAVPGEPQTFIDTSRMSPGQREAMEATEAARDTATVTGFLGDFFMGRWAPEKLFPWPEQSPEDAVQGDAFLRRLEEFLHRHTDPDAIDREGEIPPEVLDGLAKLGAFGIKIPTSYGGLGLSQTNYCRAAMLLGGWCGNLTALISAHQSIGVPQPLLLFGTPEQRRRYLPRFARGEISAFALTERGVGSDPARMQTSAVPSADRRFFTLNGEKVWCTNGTKASVILVMAKVPPSEGHKGGITTFIVEMDTPGVEIVQRCRFMGLRALYNAVIRFHDVVVPAENIVFAEGKGLKVALTTLNTGRLTLPAACAGLMRRCLAISRRWSAEREQWGAPIGRHDAIAGKLARMAAAAYALEAAMRFTAHAIDRDKHADIRLEAAACKMWGTETAWEIVNDAVQIRGGRGYETAESLKQRGETPDPLERFLRDARINTIFEGSSEIMRLFLMREALDPHLRLAGAALDSRQPWGVRARTLLRAAGFYAVWLPLLWLPRPLRLPSNLDPALRPHFRYVARTSRRLARTLFLHMLRHGPKLERRQRLLGRFADIAAESFLLAAAAARAAAEIAAGAPRDERLALVQETAAHARARIHHLFRDIGNNHDPAGHRLAQNILRGSYAWMEAPGKAL